MMTATYTCDRCGCDCTDIHHQFYEDGSKEQDLCPICFGRILTEKINALTDYRYTAIGVTRFSTMDWMCKVFDALDSVRERLAEQFDYEAEVAEGEHEASA